MGFQHHMTPKKAKVKGTIEYLERYGIPHFKSVFQLHGVGHNSGWKILRQDEREDNRTHHSICLDCRGRKKKLSNDDLAVLERFIDTNGSDGRTVP